MRKLVFIVTLIVAFTLSGCVQTSDVKCGEGTIKVDGKCVVDTLTCEAGESKVDGECVVDELTCNTGESVVNGECVADELTCEVGEHLEFGACVADELVCETGYHVENDACVADEVTCETGYHKENNVCVLNNTDIPAWFDDWNILAEPVGDKTINDLVFSETGFTVNLGFNNRVGIQMSHLLLEAGYSYEVTFDYSSAEAGKPIFVQLQGHGGYEFTNPGVMTSGSVETFSQTLAIPPTAPGTTDGWLTIELTPSSILGEVTIENIEITKVALPVCGVNEVLKGLECVAANNGAKIIAFPEVFVAGYPYWNWIMTPVQGSKWYEELYKASVDVNGPDIKKLCLAAKDNDIQIVIGINERGKSYGEIYNTNLIIDNKGVIIGKHRKLVPTWAEKLTWSSGDGSSLKVYDTEVGPIGTLACGENTNTLARYTLLTQGELIHIANYISLPVAPADYNMAEAIKIRAAAHSFEGKLFTIVSCSTISQEIKDALREDVPNVDDRRRNSCRRSGFCRWRWGCRFAGDCNSPPAWSGG